MDAVQAGGLAIGDGHPTRVMGVLNVSRESPYDPSVFDDPSAAAAYVDEEVVGEGADIVDVGLESANKRFEVLSAEEELQRLEVAIEAMESVNSSAVFSIETRYHEVAERAIDAGFEMVNDVCGFADPAMPEVCAERDVAVVKMASPPDLERPGAVEETDWVTERGVEWAAEADYVDMIYAALERGGLTEKTIVDPAFGGWSEAKTLEDDRETLRRLREFRALGRPVLVSINRKNFLRELTGRSTEEALPVSLAATAMAVDRGAHVVRTHDVAETLDAVRVGDAFADELLSDPAAGVEQLPVRTAAEFERYVTASSGGESGRERGDESGVVPDDGAFFVFALHDLSREDALRLRKAADGGCITVVSGDPVLLAGTGRGIQRLIARVEARGALERAMRAIRSEVE